MVRHVAIAATLILATATPSLAQTHDRSHAGPRQHGPDHIRPDSVTHAMMHGSWAGTLKSPHGASQALLLSVARDSAHRVMLRLHADRTITAGLVSDVAMKDKELRWTQVVSGQPCKATAMLTAKAPSTPETLRGKMSCATGDYTFALHKTSE